MPEIVKEPQAEHAYRITVNRKPWGVIYAHDGYAAIAQVNRRLGHMKAATANINASKIEGPQ